MDPLQEAVHGLARQPTFTDEKTVGKWVAGGRFLHRCWVIAFVGSLFPFALVAVDALQGVNDGAGWKNPWLKAGTTLFAVSSGCMALRTRPRKPGAHPV